jgi:hypothetical protein
LVNFLLYVLKLACGEFKRRVRQAASPKGAKTGMMVFLSQTDHLSDRELYTLLWDDTLREPVKDVPLDESSAWHIDLLSGGGEEDTRLYMKYYADEETRRRWLADFPDDEVPSHEEPPYDRDRHLPQTHSGARPDERGELM